MVLQAAHRAARCVLPWPWSTSGCPATQLTACTCLGCPTEKRFLTHEQVAALADACGPQRLLVLVLACTGLRWGEATALRVRRVDLLRGRLRIEEAVTEVNGKLVFGTPKTHATRTVVVPRFLLDDLAEHLAGKSAEAFVFASAAGPAAVGELPA